MDKLGCEWENLFRYELENREAEKKEPKCDFIA
jgi:hypothetical protein